MGRLLAIDHGEKRIGLAISDPNKIISKPLKTILLSDIELFYKKLLEIILDYDIEKLIIGLPVGMDGNYTLQTKKVEALSTKGAPQTFPRYARECFLRFINRYKED